ncbi:MAG: hypothetical protein WAJ91_19065 [Rhodoplanes sp.]
MTAELDDFVEGKPEEAGDVDGVALHHGKQLFFPGWEALSVLAANDCLVPDVIPDLNSKLGFVCAST